MWWVDTKDHTFTASGNGGQRLTVIPAIQTVVVNLMNTDDPGPRLNSTDWDAILAKVLTARR
jgi:CubicO group peptidase (beta-lactamase class C family)